MYSLSTRLNTVFFFGVKCLVILSAFNILSTFFLDNKPIVKHFDITKFSSLYNNPYSLAQHSNGLMNFNIDFTPCFNWNNNLVFAWITAEYTTGKKNQKTMVTIYDNIMLRSEPEKHKVSFDSKSFEYPLIDVYKTLEKKKALFKLHWEHMPVVGPILKKEIVLGEFTLPEKITKNPSKNEIVREVDYEDEDS